MNCKVCSNTSVKNPTVSFFRFPRENAKCRKWAERCDLLDLFEKYGTSRFYKSFRICSDHFDKRDIVFDGRKKRLLQFAAPESKVPELETSDENNIIEEEDTTKLVENMCRLCATEDTSLTNIFGWSGKVLNLEKKLKNIPLSINEHDNLHTTKICSQCISKLNELNEFVTSCVEAETKLKIILKMDINAEVQPIGSTDLSKTTNSEPVTKVTDSTNLLTCFPETDLYDLLLQDNFINQDECYWEQPEVECTITNQLLNNPNLIEEIGLDENVGFEHDYSIVVSSDLLSAQPEVITDNDQNFVEESGHICDICFESFCSSEVLNTHYLNHFIKFDSKVAVPCDSCNDVTCDRFDFEDNVCEHEGNKNDCEICDQTIHEVAFLEQHAFLHELGGSCDCFPNLRAADLADIDLEPEEQPSESLLDLGENEASLFRQLNETKMPKISFKSREKRCRFCDKLFKNPEVCSAHEKTHTGKTPYQCGQCEKSFRTRSSLRQHKSVHSKRLYNCTECEMTFKRKDALNSHLRMHARERPFRCKSCGFAFKQRGDCIQHEKNHEIEESDFCLDADICDAIGDTTLDISALVSELESDVGFWDDDKHSPILSPSLTEDNTELDDIVAEEIIPFITF